MTSTRLIRALLVTAGFFIVGIGAQAAPVDVNNPPQGRFVDQWVEVFMDGQKIGYGHIAMTRDGEFIKTRNMMRMELRRAGQVVKVATIQETRETLAGRPRSFDFEMDMSVVKTKLSGEIENGKVRVTSEQFGMKDEQTHDFPGHAVMTWGIYRDSMLKGSEPGTTYTQQVYSPELRLDGAVSAETTVGEWETITHGGKNMRAQQFAVAIQSPFGTMHTKNWLNEDRMTVKASIPTGMGAIELFVVDQEQALRDFIAPEFFMKTVIELDKPIDVTNARQIRYEVSTTCPDVDLTTLPTTGMQRFGAKPAASGSANGAKSVDAAKKSSIELIVTRQPRAKSKGSASTADMAEYLSGNTMMNIDDPTLRALADKAVDSATDPFEVGDQLRKFVSRYVLDKSLDIGFASAAEVARNREGDCTEHSVLLAALGRVKGIPSRVAVGLAYVDEFGGRRSIFGYHMWTQFYIHGQWYDFDAALGESNCNPGRIAFTVSSLKNAGMADLSLPLIYKIGNIDIKVLEVEKSSTWPKSGSPD